MKNDKILFPAAIVGIDSPKSNTARGCSFGDVGLGGSLQAQTIDDWEDEDLGLDKLLQVYCSGRGSWGAVGPPGSSAGEGVSLAYCKNTSSTTCPSIRPVASPGSRTDYMHLWASGALAIRKAALGARLPVLRQVCSVVPTMGIRDSPGSLSSCSGIWVTTLGSSLSSKPRPARAATSPR